MRIFCALFLFVSLCQTHPIQSDSENEPIITESQPIDSTVTEELTVPPPRQISPQVDTSVDTNGDGELDLSEVQYAAFVHHGLSGSVVEDMFKQVDTNNDNLLDAREFDAIRMLVLEKAENAALRYLQNVDIDRDGLLSLQEAQAYLLKEYGIGNRDVVRLWKLVTPSIAERMNSTLFSKLRRRVRGMTIRLARQLMKTADVNGDGHISVDEAQAIAFEQEGIGAGDVASMVGSVDENLDGELNAPEFADFERIVRARAIENSKKAMRVVDTDNSGTLTLDEAKRVAFEHYGFDEETLSPFFGQADENEDGQLDPVEFAGFRSVIRARSVKDAMEKMKKIDKNGDGLISTGEATESTSKEDDMDEAESLALFHIADQNKSGKLDKVELADFNRLVRLSSIKFATDHFKEFDLDGNDLVTFEEIALLIEQKYGIPMSIIQTFFDKIDVDGSADLNPAEIVDFRHLIRSYVAKQKKLAPTTSTTTSTSTITTEKPTTTEKLSTTEKLTTTSMKPSSTTEEIEMIPNDVIAQDIMPMKSIPITSTTTKVTELPTTETSTEPPTTELSTTTTSSPTTSTPSTIRTTKPAPVTRKQPKSTTTTSSTSTTKKVTDEVFVEEIIYEDENGNRMMPKKRKAQDQDVSYEEVIEYVDEPAT
ncbi:unnamed protein product [Caenorhabditis angaria]|uniref:EF-hand domain-containing protein n=1 Tax=Caenorhabditis angaria TaxID=860376 RepID=A0A9P1IBQ0_9PELO|nr:unnamed protein product [Caenorhabditis angaria]